MTKKYYDYFDKETKNWIGCLYNERTNLNNIVYVYQERHMTPVYIEPEFEDGWYLVELKGFAGTYARRKKNDRGYSHNMKNPEFNWECHVEKVLAKLNDMEWISEE